MSQSTDDFLASIFYRAVFAIMFFVFAFWVAFAIWQASVIVIPRLVERLG